jgi:staphyloferrin B biosynthesis citrate synthase
MTVMPQSQSAARDFRSKILNRQHVLGTFIKLATPHVVEIVGQVGFDFVIIDQEHSPLDRAAIDIACLAARTTNIAAIVRVSEVTNILSALDSGATGVMVPHCDSPERARQIVAACRHRGGSRGFATTSRAGSYGGAAREQHIAEQDATVTCIAMIEDHAALAHLEEIAAVKGIDAFFIGRGDLTAALGVEGMDAAVKQITDVARAANMPTVALVSGRDDARAMRELGVAAFVHSNDQNLLKTAAAQALKEYGDPAAW